MRSNLKTTDGHPKNFEGGDTYLKSLQDSRRWLDDFWTLPEVSQFHPNTIGLIKWLNGNTIDKLANTGYLPCNNSKVRWLKTRSHEEHNVFMSNHAQDRHFLQKLIQVLFSWPPPSVNHDIPMPPPPEKKQVWYSVRSLTVISEKPFVPSLLNSVFMPHDWILPYSKLGGRQRIWVTVVVV